MVDYKVTYYHNTGLAWIDPNPIIKYFEFFNDMEDWINEEVERRVNETIEDVGSLEPVSEEERQGIEQEERCYIKIEQGNHIIKDTFI